jgi:hypothetical protein
MSSDHYYVVIVPHADQAAQAVNATRAIHRASRPGHASKNGAPEQATPSRGAPSRAAPSRAAPSSRATPVSSRGARRRSSTSKGVGEGAAKESAHRVRTWSVVVGDDKYDVTDFGRTCGYRIEHEGVVVWTGIVTRGSYETHTTTLPGERLQEVLRLARVGDRREAAKAGGSPQAPADPPGATPAAGPKSETRAKPKESGSPQAAEPKAKRSAQPRAKRPSKPKASASEHAPAAPPSSKAKPEASSTAPKAKETKEGKAKSRAKPKDGPPTQRTPESSSSKTSSAKPRARREVRVDDKAVLDGLLEKLRAEDATTAEQSFASLKRLWLAGGREATVAWMKKHKFPTALDAFNDWMEKNLDAAQAMLSSAPTSAKHAEVA